MHFDQTVASMASKIENGPLKTYKRKEVGVTKLTDSVVLDASEDGNSKDQIVKSSSLEARNLTGADVQPTAIPDSESENSEATEDDVKVCDICGDAGLEELLAFCCRCSDGAEHTYCMRNKLDELPGDDWLCEECKFDEETRTKGDKSGASSRAPEVQGSDQHSEKVGIMLDSKLLSKLVTEPLGEEAREKSKEEGSSYSKKEDGSSEVSEMIVDPRLLSMAVTEPLGVEGRETSKEEGSSQVPEKIVDPKHLSELVPDISSEELGGTSKEQGSSQVYDKMNDTHIDINSVSTKKASETSIRSTNFRKESGGPHGISFSNEDPGNVKISKVGSAEGEHSTKMTQPLARAIPSSLSNSPNISAGPQSSRGLLSKSVSFNNSKMQPKVKQLTGPLPHLPKMGKYTSGIKKREGLVKEMSRSASLKSSSSGHCNVEPVSKIPSKLRLTEDKNDAKAVKERNVLEKKTLGMRDLPLISPKPTDSTGIHLPKSDFRASRLPMPEILSTKRVSDDANNLGRNEVMESASVTGSRKPSSSGTCSSENDTGAQRSTPQVLGSAHRDDKIKNTTFLSSLRQAVPSGGRILRCQRCNEAGHSTQSCSIDKLRVTALRPSAERNLKDPSDRSSKWKDAVEAAISKNTVQKNQKYANHTDKPLISRPGVNGVVASQNSIPISSDGDRNLSLLDKSTNGECLKGFIGPNKTGFPVDGKLLAISSVPRASEMKSHIISDDLNVNPPAGVLSDQAAVLVSPFKASVFPQLDIIWQGGLEVFRSGGVPELCEGIQAHLSSSASPRVFEVAKKFCCRVQVNEVTRLSSWPLQFQGNCAYEDNIAIFFFAKDIESYEKKYRILLEKMLQNDLALRGNIDGVELLIFPSNTLPQNSQRWNRLFFLWGVFRAMKTDGKGTLPAIQDGGSNTTMESLATSLTSEGSVKLRVNIMQSHDADMSASNSVKIGSHSPSLSTEQLSEMHTDYASLNDDSGGGINATTATVLSLNSNLKQGSDTWASRSLQEDIIMSDKVASTANPSEDVTEIDYLRWQSSLGRKRAHSASSSSTSHASGDTVKNTGETMQHNDKTTNILIDVEKESKKIKLGHAGSSSREESPCGKFSTEAVPLESVCLSYAGVYDQTARTETLSAGRNFFPVCVLSSDDEETLDLNAPALELALGDEKKPPTQDFLPLLSPMICKGSDQGKVPGPSKDGGDDGSESLSLSLGFRAFK